MRKILLLLFTFQLLTGLSQSDSRKIYCDASLINQEFSTRFSDSKKKKQRELERFIDEKQRELNVLRGRYKESSSISIDTFNNLMNCISVIPQKSKDYVTTLNVRLIELESRISNLKGVVGEISSLNKKKGDVSIDELKKYEYILSGLKVDVANFPSAVDNKYDSLIVSNFVFYLNAELKKLDIEFKRLDERLKLLKTQGEIAGNFWIDLKDYQSICMINKVFGDDRLRLPIPKALSFGFSLSLKDYDTLSKKLIELKSSDVINCMQMKQDNLLNIEEDIAQAESELSLLMSSETQNQSFKKYITTAVAILLSIILVAFFGGVLYKSSNEIKAKLIGEAGLQFITIFVIIIAVILFGVMNILKGSELAAILSAIAGYILGKTAPPKSDKTLEMELEMLRLEEKKADRLQRDREAKEAAEKAKDLEKQATESPAQVVAEAPAPLETAQEVAAENKETPSAENTVVTTEWQSSNEEAAKNSENKTEENSENKSEEETKQPEI